MKPYGQIKENQIEEHADENVEENVENGENSEHENDQNKRSLKSRLAWLSASLFVALILLLLAIPGFVDNSTLKFKLTQKLSETLNSSLTINGDVEIDLLPFPKITAKEVLLQNYHHKNKIYNFHAKSLAIRLSLIKLFSDQFVVSKILISDATVETYLEANLATERKNKFNDILAELQKNPPANNESKDTSSFSSDLFPVEKFQSSQFSESNVPPIVVENSEFISYDKSSHKQEITEISGKVMINSEKIRASGKFTNEKITNDFNLTANFKSDVQDSTLELNSPALNVIIKGEFTSENVGIFNSDFNGKIEAEIFDLRTFYKDYLGSSSAICEKIKTNPQSIKISSDLVNKGGEITLNNLLINSTLINGKGLAVIDFTSELPKIDVNLELENLDLDGIWSGERVSSANITADTTNDLNNIPDETVEGSVQNFTPTNDQQIVSESLDLIHGITITPQEKTQIIPLKKPPIIPLKSVAKIKNFDLSAEITIKAVKFMNGDINDLSLYTTISKDGQILILPLIFNIPGEATVRINGVLENDSDLPKFIGKVDVSGKNLGESLKWLKLQSQNLKFSNLKNYVAYSDLLLVPNNIVLDNLYLNLNNGQSELLGDVKIDSSDKVTHISNKFQVSSLNIDDFFLTSGQNVYLTPGSLLRKLLWLNDIQSMTDIELTFDDLIYKGEEFSDQSSIKLNFGQGYFKISELKLVSNKTNLQASLTLDISNQNPEFNFNLIANSFHLESTKNKKPYNLSESTKPSDNKTSIADNFFDLPSLEGFSGSVNIVVSNLTLGDLAIKNSKLNGKLKDGNLTDSSFTCSIYDGNFKYDGMIGIKNDKTINGNFSLNSAKLDKLLPDLTGINNIQGTANISANITSIADSTATFFKTLDSEIKFGITPPIVSGYGLNDLVSKMFAAPNYRQELQNPEAILLNPYAKTIFKQASGSIVFDKDKEDKFSINLVTTAANGVLSGKIDLANNSIDALANIIFITGTRQKQTPINIITALKGDMRSPATSSNLDQVRQYLGLPTFSKPVEKITNATTPETPATNNSKPKTQVTFSPATSIEPVSGPIKPRGIAEKEAAENLARIKAENSKKRAFDQLQQSVSNPNSTTNSANPTTPSQ